MSPIVTFSWANELNNQRKLTCQLQPFLVPHPRINKKKHDKGNYPCHPVLPRIQFKKIHPMLFVVFAVCLLFFMFLFFVGYLFLFFFSSFLLCFLFVLLGLFCLFVYTLALCRDTLGSRWDQIQTKCSSQA